MSRLRRAIAVGAMLIGLVSLAASAAGADAGVFRLHLTGVIDQFNAAYIDEGLQTAAESGAVAVLIEIDSPGGELESCLRKR